MNNDGIFKDVVKECVEFKEYLDFLLEVFSGIVFFMRKMCLMLF